MCGGASCRSALRSARRGWRSTSRARIAPSSRSDSPSASSLPPPTSRCSSCRPTTTCAVGPRHAHSRSSTTRARSMELPPPAAPGSPLPAPPRVVVAHADLPRATTFRRVIGDGAQPIVTLVPCHRDDGTPVLSLPARRRVHVSLRAGVVPPSRHRSSRARARRARHPRSRSRVRRRHRGRPRRHHRGRVALRSVTHGPQRKREGPKPLSLNSVRND